MAEHAVKGDSPLEARGTQGHRRDSRWS